MKSRKEKASKQRQLTPLTNYSIENQQLRSSLITDESINTGDQYKITKKLVSEKINQKSTEEILEKQNIVKVVLKAKNIPLYNQVTLIIILNLTTQ